MLRAQGGVILFTTTLGAYDLVWRWSELLISDVDNGFQNDCVEICILTGKLYFFQPVTFI